IKGLFLRKIHAVTFKGFLIKLVMFILAFTLNKITD
ncbi:IS982 family transposase, partial [Terrimonas sp.]